MTLSLPLFGLFSVSLFSCVPSVIWVQARLNVIITLGAKDIRSNKSPDAPWTVDGAGLPSNASELLPKLVEFMEHDEKPLPIDIRLVGALADKCRAFAKALHYKEMEFEGACSKKMDANPVAVVKALIHINNQLYQHEVFICLS
ncbi:hypothetical protein CsSME_00002500 [Camellia sinensis var. sinensis]